MSIGNNDIAIIGMGCRFPDADRSDIFYKNLLANKDSIREIPEERWSYADLYSGQLEKNRIHSKWGGFISGLDEFDPRFFKILPNEAELMDPQQKLFLSCSWEALEDAGYARRRAIAGKPIGVYAGVTWNEFSLFANEYGYWQDEYKGAGSLYWGIPNRVSYFFDLKGPSIAIDTACSSSLVAIHLATQGLLSGECEMALAGGVNLNLHPAKYLFLSSSNFLSSEGKCRGFGEGGNGYVPSEGVGVIVLKTLSAAIEAGDRIYAVIKASATNHGGKATGYTVPNPRAHQEVIQSALKRAQVDARDISYIECHGTGTDLGDPIEIAGLRLAFEQTTQEKQFCGIGTVKSNIGHCEATAGIAGLIKVAHSMQEGMIPATLHAEIPNKKIDFDNSPFYLVQKNSPWKTNSEILFAGLSSFGAGGSNCHCVIQSYSAEKRPKLKIDSNNTYQIIPISSLNSDRTFAYCQRLKAFLDGNTISLIDLSFTLRQREVFDHRLVFLADSSEMLLEQLDHYIETRPDKKVIAGNASENLKQCATRWIDGEIKFEALPKVEQGRLVSLPAYAFEKTRSWIHSSRRLYQKNVYSNNALHPLVDKNVSTASRGVFEKRLNRSEYFVDEHWIQGYPVLPGVCLVEMAMFSAKTYLEFAQLSLTDIWFLEPVALRNIDSIPFQLEIIESTTTPRFEVFSQERSVKHATGRILKINPEVIAASTINLEEILSRCHHSISKDQFYERFARSGIVQTGRFKVVTEFKYNESAAIAVLNLSALFKETNNYVMNPTLLDGAVQTAMVHLFQQLPDTKTVLPFQIGTCIQPQALNSTVCIVVATLKNIQSKKYDIVICDKSGNILFELRDFVLKEYQDKHHKNRALAFSIEHHQSSMLIEVPDISTTPEISLVATEKTGALIEKRIPTHWSRIMWGSGYLDHETLLSQIENNKEGISRIALLIKEPDIDDTGQTYYATVIEQTKNIFDFAQTLARSSFPCEVLICIISDHESTGAVSQACLAFIKCLNLELSKCRFRLLELDTQIAETRLYPLLAAEFINPEPDIFAQYKMSARFTQKLKRLEFETTTHPIGSIPKAWIVTGAGGRLGMMISQHLLRQGRNVVLLGRSALENDKRVSLQTFSKECWEYIQCDLNDEQQIKKALEQAVDRFGRGWGLVHCAGIIEDGSFLQKEWGSFERVIQTKIKSLLFLCKQLADYETQRLVLFSSLTSLIGNKGQVDYAFANGYLDGFASLAKEISPDGPVVTTINWPYWEEGGMRIAAEKLPAYMDTFLTQALSSSVGLEFFDQLLAQNSMQASLLYTGAQLADVEAKLYLKDLPDKLKSRTEHDAKTQSISDSNNAINDQVQSAAIQKYLLHFFEQELKLELNEDDLQLEFSDLGVDSIAQMDLITRLEKTQLFENIPQTLLVENTTLEALIMYFKNNHVHVDYGLN